MFSSMLPVFLPNHIAVLDLNFFFNDAFPRTSLAMTVFWSLRGFIRSHFDSVNNPLLFPELHETTSFGRCVSLVGHSKIRLR